MSVVTFPNGNKYDDDGTTPGTLLNGGHRTKLVPMLADAIALAIQYVAYRDAAAGSASAAAASAANALGYSQTALDKAAQTVLDRIATGEDRTQTGLDRAAAVSAANQAKGYRDEAQQIVVGDIHGTAPTQFRNNAENDARFRDLVVVTESTSMLTAPYLQPGRYRIDAPTGVPAGFSAPLQLEVFRSDSSDNSARVTQRITSMAGAARQATRAVIVLANGTTAGADWAPSAAEGGAATFTKVAANAISEKVQRYTAVSSNLTLDFDAMSGVDLVLAGNVTLVLPYIDLPDNVEITRVIRIQQHAATAYTVTILGVAAATQLTWLTEGGAAVPAPAVGKVVEVIATGRKRSATAIDWLLGKGRSDA